MRERLEKYLEVCDQYHEIFRRASYNYTPALRPYEEESQGLEPTVLRIMEALDPDLTVDFLGLAYSDTNAAQRTRAALGILRDLDELSTRLAPTTPSLSAETLHPTIWSAAATVWGTGEYKIAVGQAAVALSAEGVSG